MKIEYLTDVPNYLKNFPQFDVLGCDEKDNIIIEGYYDLTDLDTKLLPNYDFKQLFSKKAIIVFDLTSRDDFILLQ